jgi:hypothetical protein
MKARRLHSVPPKRESKIYVESESMGREIRTAMMSQLHGDMDDEYAN